MKLPVLALLGLFALSKAVLQDEGVCEKEYIPELDDYRVVCRYDFEIEHDYTMTYGGNTVVSDCEDPDGNTVTCVACYIDDPDCAGTDRAISFEDVKLSGDGVQRRVITVNGRIPGPAIRVKYGSIVRVTMHNAMMQDATTIHWHGIYQMRTPWMDGVPYISQCPVPPGGTFVYSFAAMPPGTFWYHSHTGVQFSEGMAGPIVIYEEDEPNQHYYDFNLLDLDDDRHIPEFDQFIMMVSDWQHEESHHMFEKLFKAGGWFEDGVRFHGERTFDGLEISPIPYKSGIFNGRGRYDLTDPQKRTPYFGFAVKPGHRYRFRVVGAQMVFSYRISVDDHKLKVITSDGFDVNPVDVDWIVVSAGERYDFVLSTKSDPEHTEYVVRADTMRFDEVNRRPFNDTNAAVLRYGDTSGTFLTDNLPADVWRHCNKDTAPCVTLNCPFEGYPIWSNTKCIHIADLSRSARELALDPTPAHVTKEAQYFMNFVFGGKGGMALGTALPGQKPAPVCNGKAFVSPTQLSIHDFDPSAAFEKCDEECDAPDHHTVCKCTNFITMEEEHYQFVFTSVGSGGSHNGSLHPIHIHGHSLLVTKMGFPEQDENGHYVQANQDLCCPCPDDETQCCSLDSMLIPCNKPRWRNDTWNEDPDSIPQNLFNPPRKDTVLLPSGGYVVARLTTDNPGWWFLHCHIEHHLLGGMAILLNVKPNEQPSAPGGFPGCGDFDWNESDFFEKYREQEPTLTNVAPTGVAFVSSGSNAPYGSDGNPQTCAFIDADDKSWWKVDLGKPYNVHRVILKRPPNKWRNDLRCGADYPLDDGSPAQCDPSSIYPCCSPGGWCGNTADHCTCGTCTDYSNAMKWRSDLRCGPDFPASDGSPGECNPNGEFPCCSPSGWCGKTSDHCDCADCHDYRGGGLVGAVVRVGSESDIEIHHQCGEVLTARSLQMTITTVDCIQPIVGRYVSLQTDRGNPVTLCEVSVMAPESGTEQPTFDSGCGTPHDLTGDTGTITSLGYDGTALYENNARCEFSISSENGKNIELHFEALDLEGGFDYVWVIGPQLQKIAKFTGEIPPEPLETEYSQIFVRFTSDDGGQATGFKINWQTA